MAGRGRSWPVVAHGSGLGEYLGDADNGQAVDDLVARVLSEINQFGEPQSLPRRHPVTPPIGRASVTGPAT